MAHRYWLNHTKDLINQYFPNSSNIVVIEGGELRNDTIMNAIDYILENFEIAMDNQKTHMLIRRIDNMTKKYYNRSQSIMLPYQEIKLDNNKYIRMRNLEGSLNELWDKILTSVEVKFLYLLTIDEKISDKRKGTIFSNMMFVHPTLQDRIFKKQINIGSYVKEEDNIYNGLWENIKEIYENELSNYCYNFSKELIKTMIFEDITDEEILIYEIYLRSLFNYLDDDVLENLNYEYHNEEEFKIENEFGDKCVREAFRKINEDTNTINKIKTL